MTPMKDPEHPILPEAWKHEVIEFHWNRSEDEPYVDLVLRHAESGLVRRLRFLWPEEVRFVNAGMGWGLFIQDIRSRQLQGLNVKVGNFENCDATVELMARDVMDITDHPASSSLFGPVALLSAVSFFTSVPSCLMSEIFMESPSSGPGGVGSPALPLPGMLVSSPPRLRERHGMGRKGEEP